MTSVLYQEKMEIPGDQTQLNDPSHCKCCIRMSNQSQRETDLSLLDMRWLF